MKFRTAIVNPMLLKRWATDEVQMRRVHAHFWEVKGQPMPLEFYSIYDAAEVLGIPGVYSQRLLDVFPGVKVLGDVGRLVVAADVNAMVCRGLTSVGDAARVMGLSRTQVSLLITTGELDHMWFGHRRIFIYRDSIRAYAQKRIDKWQKAASI